MLGFIKKQNAPHLLECGTKVSPWQMLKIMLYAYHEGNFSSRGIEKACRRDINYMYLLEGRSAPDHATIARFRSIHFAEVAEKYPTSVGCFFMKMAVLSRRVEKNRWRPIRRQKNVGAVLEFHTVFEVQPVPVENTGFCFQGNITSPMEMYPQCIPRNSSSLVGLCSVFRRCVAGRLNAEHIGILTKSSNSKGPGSCLPGPILGADNEIRVFEPLAITGL